MNSEILQYIDAASTPLLAIIMGIIWRIKTNDLPHIDNRISKIEGFLEADKESK